MYDQQFELYLIRQALKPYTIKVHLKTLSTFQSLYPTLTHETAEAYIMKLLQQGTKHASINKYISTLKHYARFKGLDPKIQGIQVFKPQPFTRGNLSEQETLDFLNLPPPRKANKEVFDLWGRFWNLVIHLGARPGEVAKLSARDIDMANMTITFRNTKTNDDRTIPIRDVIRADVEYLMKHHADAFFITSRGVPFSYGSWAKDFISRCRRLNIDYKNRVLSAYSFRSSFVTEEAVAGAPIFDVQAIVGHKSIETTAIYYRGNLKTMAKALDRHPLIARKSNGKDYIMHLKELLESARPEDNPHISYSLKVTEKGLRFEADVIEAVDVAFQ